MNKKESTLISFEQLMHANDPDEEPEEMLILESKVQSITYKLYAMFSEDYDEIIIRVVSDIALPISHPAKVFNYTTRIPARESAYNGAVRMANLLFHYMRDASYPGATISNYKGKEAKYPLTEPLVEGE